MRKEWIFASQAEAAGGGAGLPPNSFPNLEVWYDVTNTGSLTFDGGNIEQINDLSGNARHASQPVAASRPLYDATGIGGMPALDFDGVDDFLKSTAFTIPTKPLTAFAVFEFGTLDFGVFYSYNHSSGLSEYFSGYQRNVNITAGGYRNGATNFILQSSSTAGSQAIALLGTNTTAPFTYLIDSTGRTDLNSDVAVSNVFDNFMLGRLRLISSGGYTNGKLSEVFMYSSVLSATDQQSLFDYLANKYSLTAPTA